MKNKYQSLFPTILSIEELAVKVDENACCRKIFASWNAEEQMQFLELCTGLCGPNILWDCILAELFSDGKNDFLLCRMLECLLEINIEKVELVSNKEKEIEMNEFCILEAFVWERINSADDCLNYKVEERYVRIYKSNCRNISNNVLDVGTKRGVKEYSIVLYETAPEELICYDECFIHHGCQQTDSGVRLGNMQEYCFIVKDIFAKKARTDGVHNEAEAWIAFLMVEDVEVLWNLLVEYPMVWPLYDAFYDLCSNKLSFIMQNLSDMFFMKKQVYRKYLEKRLFASKECFA